MSNSALLKAAAVIGGILWAVYLATQWNDYFSALSAIESSPFGGLAMALGGQELVDSARNKLILQSIGAAVLLFVGFAIKDDKTSK